MNKVVLKNLTAITDRIIGNCNEMISLKTELEGQIPTDNKDLKEINKALKNNDIDSLKIKIDGFKVNKQN